MPYEWVATHMLHINAVAKVFGEMAIQSRFKFSYESIRVID